MEKISQRLVTGLMVLVLATGVILIEGTRTPAGAAGTIHGYTTHDPGGGILPNVTVIAHNVATGETTTTTSGSVYAYYTMDVPAGTYTVEVDPEGTAYLGIFYDGKETFDEADTVAVLDGQTTSLINIRCPEGGKIEGTVRSATTSSPVDSVSMTAYNIDHGLSTPALTGLYGNYSIVGLETGSYLVTANPANLTYNYAWQYYTPTPGGMHNMYEATYVEVTAGATVPDIDIYLEPGGSISGTVIDDSDPPAGLADVAVGAYGCDNPYYWNYTNTATDGTYTIKGLLTDSYRVGATLPETNYMGQYYNQTHNIYQATYVDVTVPDVSPIPVNFALAAGGMISGTIRDSYGPVISLGVTATEVETGYYRIGESLEDGTYTIRGLPLGNYVVTVNIAGTEYIKYYYNNTDEYDLATQVEVAEANKTTPVPNINFLLVKGGSISGTVISDADSAPIAGVVVYAYKSENGYYGTAVTQDDGTYTIIGLKPGDYTMQLNAQGTEHAGEYYNNTFVFDEASPVTVTAGSLTSGIDFGLAAGGTITGTVTNGASEPVEGVWVTAYDIQATGDYGTAETDEFGAYTITGLLPADYVLEVDVLNTGYVREYYSNVVPQAYTYEDATAVNVALGVTVTGIDFQLLTGGIISGTIYDTDGVTPLIGPPVDIDVFIGAPCDLASQTILRSSSTKACTGEYEVVGIRPETVYVRAVWHTHGSEWWVDPTSTQVCYESETLSLTSGGTVTGVDFQLDPDTDGDFATDTVEAVLGTDPNDYDSDGDGIIDGLEDRVHDGIIDPAMNETNPLLYDSDSDGIYDATEKGLVEPQRGDPPAYFVADEDSTTRTDPMDSDTDDDGINDGAEDLNHNGLFEPGLGETDPTRTEITGDIEPDYTVDGVDLATIAGNFGSCPECPGDLNGDDVVTQADLSLFAGSFGTAN